MTTAVRRPARSNSPTIALIPSPGEPTQAPRITPAAAASISTDGLASEHPALACPSPHHPKPGRGQPRPARPTQP